MSQSIKRLSFLLLALALSGAVVAQETPSGRDVELREDHPREYVVQEGDTLWDIAGRFLTRPWQWPAIWQANPEIDNPHLIFPGDVISLVYIDGEPRLVVDGTRRMGPEVRRERIEGPVTTIPLDAIQTFLVKPRVVDVDALAGFPYVVANEERQHFAAVPDRTYARGMENYRVGDQVTIARLTFQFEDQSEEGRPGAMRQNRMRPNMSQVPSGERPVGSFRRKASQIGGSGRVIGYELWEVARAEVLKTGDPAILGILDSEQEVRAGDYVLPIDPHLYDLTFHPRPMSRPIPEGAHVIAINDAHYGVGHYQIVALGIGSANGVEPGHTFSTFRPGETVKDRFVGGLRGRPVPARAGERKVTLPDEISGQVMVFRTFDHISYALVMGGERAVREGDLLYHPDRKL